MSYPQKQSAIQLTGPEKLELTTDKPVANPGPYQILARIDAVGVCFSDLKLLKQFSNHPRKAEVVSGIDKGALSEIPSYKPGSMPTVPGHEAVCTVVATGKRVVKSRVGQRALI
ncbi:MAG: alcohol dehydrogenase catalytic domain-containing protein, partial [Verrucomicrobiota bacterium]